LQSSGESPVLSPSQLLDIGDYDEDIIRKLVEQFTREAPVFLQEIQHAIDMEDRDAIARKVHKLNGLVANLGGQRFLETGFPRP
jgi:HPt (histidine-containing phosphotransfer) domain-containing protein